MLEVFAWEDTLPAAYHSALTMLERYGEISDCADWNTTQKELSMTMVVGHPIQEPRISKLFIGGPKELEQYRQEMLDGILDFEIENGNWDYTYHDRMVNYPKSWKAAFAVELRSIIPNNSINQIEFVLDELRRNPSSRRAVIVIRDVSVDTESNDPACLQNIQYFIRNGKLDCCVLFRSNDACKATFMNAFALICLQEKIAERLGVQVGQYTHRANSFHCYEKDFDLLKGYVKRIEQAEDIDDVTYGYAEDWMEEMESFKPEIAEQVKILKEQSQQ